MKEIKKILSVMLSIGLMMSLITLDVSASTGNVYGALNFTSSGTISNTGYSYDASTNILTISDDTTIEISETSTSAKGISLPDDATIQLDADLTVKITGDKQSYGIYSAGSLNIVGSGNLTIEMDCGYGIYTKDDLVINTTGNVYVYSGRYRAIYANGSSYDNISISCHNLDVIANTAGAIASIGTLSIVTSGYFNASTVSGLEVLAGQQGVSIESTGAITLKNETGNIYNAYVVTTMNDIEIICEVDVTISGGTTAFYFWTDVNHELTFNVDGVVDITTEECGIYSEGNLSITSTNSVEIGGSVEVVGNLDVMDNTVLNISEALVSNDGYIYLDSETSVQALLLYATSYEIYGTLYAGQLVGNTLSIYDGANVILDYSMFDDIEDYSLFKFPILLSGTDESMPTITLDDHILIYTPTTPAAQVLTEQEGELGVISYLLTITKDGEELTYSDDETHNAAMYIVFGAGYSIDVTITGKGSVTPDTSQIIEGEDVSYTFIAEEGYEVSEVIVDGVSVDVTTTYTFEEVVEDHTLEVVFSEIVVEDNTDTNADANTDTDEDDEDTDVDVDLDTDVDTDVDTDTNVDIEVEDSVDTFDTSNTSGYLTLSLFSLMMAYCIRRRKQIY